MFKRSSVYNHYNTSQFSFYTQTTTTIPQYLAEMNKSYVNNNNNYYYGNNNTSAEYRRLSTVLQTFQTLMNRSTTTITCTPTTSASTLNNEVTTSSVQVVNDSSISKNNNDSNNGDDDDELFYSAGSETTVTIPSPANVESLSKIAVVAVDSVRRTAAFPHIGRCFILRLLHCFQISSYSRIIMSP